MGKSAMRWFRDQPGVVKVALVLAATLVAIGAGDVLGWDWVNDLGRQQVATTVLAEAVLLIIVFFVVDDAAERRTRKAWDRPLTSVVPGLMSHATLTRGAFEHAYQDLDSERDWERFQVSAKGFAEHVVGSQAIMSVTPDTAALWTEFALLAREYEHLATAQTSQDSSPFGGTTCSSRNVIGSGRGRLS